MVSTRGGARTGSDDGAQVDELALRKKPVRKATAKPTAKATTKATVKTVTNTKVAPKTRVTRSKRIAPEIEQEQVEDQVDELDQEVSVETSKPTRKTTSPTKKEDDPAKAASGRRPQSTTARVANPRTAPSRSVEDDAPALPPPIRSTATRATRATASKSKAPPLSPKKVTQVAQAPAKNTRNAKAVPMKSGKTAAATKPAARRRNVSDENAGIVVGMSAADGAVAPVQAPAPSNSNRRKRAAPQIIEDETSMSSRPTTPADSPPRYPDNGVDDRAEEVGESESEAEDDLEISSDELFGPKTPMKRLSPREGFKFISAQKSSRRGDPAMQTPARWIAASGVQRGTPQTQALYRKPTVPSSEIRPMTVARATDRAMVFPKLQPLPVVHASDAEMDLADGQSELGHERIEGAEEVEVMSEDEALVQPDDNAFEERISDTMQHSDGASADDSVVETEEMQDITLTFDNDFVDESLRGISTEPVIHFSMEVLRSEVADEASGGNHLNAHDPNETPVEDESMDDVVEEHSDISDISADSVIITRQAASEDESVLDDSMIDDSMEDFHPQSRTTRPETIVWQNIRQDVTIPFNFDGEVSPCRALPQVEPTESLIINHLYAHSTEDESDREATSTGVHDAQMDRASVGTIRQSFDATVRLSDFINSSYLAERQQETPASVTPNAEQLPVEIQDRGESGGSACAIIDFELPSTPFQEPFSESPDVPEATALQGIPHYALPTIATRRKSLPVISFRTPSKNGARPQTAGGASLPRVLRPFVDTSSFKDQSPHTMTPLRSRPSTAQGGTHASRSRTPFASRSNAGTPRPSVSQPSANAPSRNAYDFGLVQSPSPEDYVLPIRKSPAKTPASGRISAASTPIERFPGLPPRETYEDLVAPLIDGTSGTPAARSPWSASTPRERFPGLPSARTYEELAVEKTNQDPSPTRTPSTPEAEVKERYPGLPHRRTYEEHAKTAMPPARFRTPGTHQTKRPATTRKPTSLRKIALKAAGSHTPVKTPLKAGAMTPGQIPCTPHPDVPLKGVCAFVEVFLSDGSCATTTYISVLQALGAKTTKTFNTDRVTHVVYKEGSPTTLQRIRHHNKEVEQSGVGTMIHCVNGRWVNDCKQFGKHMDETDEAYGVEVDDMPASKRRRKTMEPTSLINIGGNVVRDRKSSSSLSRNTMMKLVSSPADAGSSTSPIVTPPANKENNGDESFSGDESPDTPTYLAAPEKLVQQTAPAKRVRRLDLQSGDAKNRRLTFWNGGARMN